MGDLFAHGVRRITEDVDILVTKDGLRTIHASLAGLGYVASGSSSADRAKDLADVQELIKELHLPEDFAERLDPSVRGEYARLWTATRTGQRYLLLFWDEGDEER